MEKDKATLPDTEQLKTKVSEIIWEEFEAHLKEGEYFNGNDLGEKITELFAKEVIELREQLENRKEFEKQETEALRLLNYVRSENKVLREALRAVYQDIELNNVKGGSDELNVMVQNALAISDGK